MLQRNGFVESDRFLNWCKSYEDFLEPERWNGKENRSGRKSVWFGKGVELGIKSKQYQGLWINHGLRQRINQIWQGEDWNSLLLYRYGKGVGLNDHIDRDIFDRRVIVINSGNCSFRYGGVEFEMGNGEVIEFDSGVKHGIKEVKRERWSLSIRKVL